MCVYKYVYIYIYIYIDRERERETIICHTRLLTTYIIHTYRVHNKVWFYRRGKLETAEFSSCQLMDISSLGDKPPTLRVSRLDMGTVCRISMIGQAKRARIEKSELDEDVSEEAGRLVSCRGLCPPRLPPRSLSPLLSVRVCCFPYIYIYIYIYIHTYYIYIYIYIY